MLVLPSPCDKLPHYFPHAIIHVYLVTGSLTRVWYFYIVSPVTECTTGAQKCSILMEVRIVSSSLFIWRGRVCLGLVLQVFSANSINTYCKIMQVFWNCGSAMHALVKYFVSLINTGWGFVLSLLSVNEVFSSRIFCLPGTYACLLIVVNFLFNEAIVITLVISLLSRGVS